MKRHGRYAGVSGVFAIEGPAPPGYHDEHAVAAHSLAATASANGIACSILEIRGKHDWNAGALAFKQTFAWLASELRTPGVPPVPIPGTPVQSVG